MGKIRQPINLPRGDVLGPLAKEVTLIVKNLALACASAEVEARLCALCRVYMDSRTTQRTVRQELSGKNLYVVSNREPYMHIRSGGKIECIVPAGGLVTALDPIMRACSGVWIAHGSGDADVEVTDKNGKLEFPTG